MKVIIRLHIISRGGYLLAVDANASRAELVMKLIPVGTGKQETHVYIKRSLPSDESSITTSMFSLYLPSSYYDWLNTTAGNQISAGNEANASMQKIDELKTKRKEYESFLNNRTSGMDPTFFQNQIAIIDNQIAELEKQFSTEKATGTESDNSREPLPFPEEMTSSLFSSQANFDPDRCIYPLNMDDFTSCGSYKFMFNAEIRSMNGSNWGSLGDSSESAFKSIGINLGDIYEFWTLDSYEFLIQFKDGTQVGKCNYPENENVYAVTVTIPARETDEFIYTGSAPYEGVLLMKVKRDGIDFELNNRDGNANFYRHNYQVNYKKANGDRYEGRAHFQQNSSDNNQNWILKTLYMPKTINAETWESSFTPYTGTWKFANGKTEEWKEGINMAVQREIQKAKEKKLQEEKKANEQGLAKALPPFYQKYGKANVDQFVYGVPTVGMSLAMIRDLVYSKNQYIRAKSPYTLLLQREITVSEAIKYGSGTQVWRLGFTSGYYNDVYFMWILYVRNGKVVAGHVNW